MANVNSFVRVCISVPCGIKTEMDKAGGQTNWSAVAAQAFQNEVTRLKSRRKVDNMNSVIERMKAADELEAKELFESGRNLGIDWAESDATRRQLRRLDEAGAHKESSPMWKNKSGAFGWPGRFLAILYSTNEIDQDLIDSVFGEDNNDAKELEYLLGFADGALDIWSKVADKL